MELILNKSARPKEIKYSINFEVHINDRSPFFKEMFFFSILPMEQFRIYPMRRGSVMMEISKQPLSHPCSHL